MCTVSKRVLVLSEAKCLYIKDLVLNKDLFGILGPYWVFVGFGGSACGLLWLLWFWLSKSEPLSV